MVLDIVVHLGICEYMYKISLKTNYRFYAIIRDTQCTIVIIKFYSTRTTITKFYVPCFIKFKISFAFSFFFFLSLSSLSHSSMKSNRIKNWILQ